MNIASLGCLLVLAGIALPFLAFCGIAVVPTWEESVGGFMAWTMLVLVLAAVGLVVRAIIVKMRD